MDPSPDDNLVVRLLRELRSDMATEFRMLRADMDRRFDQVDERFNRIDDRFVSLELRLGDVQGLAITSHLELVGLVRRIESHRLDELTARVAELERKTSGP